MKKIFGMSLLIIGLLLSQVAEAQMPRPITMGVKAGVSLSTTSVDEYDLTLGFDVGAVVDFNFTRNLFLRTGLDFVMKGSKLDLYAGRMVGTVAEYNNKYTRLHLNYLQVPLMIGYRTPVSPGVFVYASGGVYGSYGIWASGKYRYTTNLITEKNENIDYDSFKDMQLKRFDFGLIGSIGVEYDRYSVNVGYEYGLINLNKTSNVLQPSNFTNGDSWHNMNATCTLGYRF